MEIKCVKGGSHTHLGASYFAMALIAPKNCISDSFVDYKGYSFSSKGFLPTVVDIMVI